MSAAGPVRSCAEIAPLLVFYACDEVSAQERVTIEAHLVTCEDCREQLAEERAFQEAVGSMPQAADTWTVPASCWRNAGVNSTKSLTTWRHLP